MQIIVVGAGVVGAATSYFLSLRGHRVQLLERADEPGQGCSQANAGQLSWSYTDTLADPGLLARLPGIVLGRDPGMRVRLDWALVPWGLRFLWYCTRQRSDRNTATLLRQAAASAQALEQLLDDVPLRFHHRQAGKLLLTGSQHTLRAIERRAGLKRSLGVEVDVIDADECRRIEPALQDWRGQLLAGAYARGDATGDAQEFTRQLCDHLQLRGMCTLQRRTQVLGLLRQGRRVVGVRTATDELRADAVVLCSGIDTAHLLRGTGVAVSMYPLKGYSITAAAGAHAPVAGLTDLDRRLVFARLGDRVRLAGLADCEGMDAAVDDRRIAHLLLQGRSVLPGAALYDGAVQGWAGLRPATPSGLPVVGPTRLAGLYLNVGHGALGWTLACGSARMLADQLS